MKKTASFIVWSLVFLVLLVGLDRFFVAGPSDLPALRVVRSFYLDFRHRLFTLVAPGEDQSVEAVLHRAGAPPEKGDAPAPSEPRYVYVDGEGQLHFAATLEDVPQELRSQARPLAQ